MSNDDRQQELIDKGWGNKNLYHECDKIAQDDDEPLSQKERADGYRQAAEGGGNGCAIFIAGAIGLIISLLWVGAQVIG